MVKRRKRGEGNRSTVTGKKKGRWEERGKRERRRRERSGRLRKTRGEGRERKEEMR